MELSTCLENAIWAAFLLTVWFETDALPEYLNLLGLKKITLFEEYLQTKQSNIFLNYPIFLNIKVDNFVTRLISCPFCFGFWIGFIFCWGNSLTNIAGTYLITILIYFSIKRIYEKNH
jgi:hypothetical protein